MNITRRSTMGFASAAALAVLGAVTTITPAFAAEVTLRMHSFLPGGANVPKHILEPWADKIEADSDGRIKVQRFHAMQLGGKPPELIDQVIDGVADITWTVAGYSPGRFPRAEVFELPFTMTDAEAVSRAYWTIASESMMDTDFKDFHVLAVHVHGPGLIHSKDPIETVEDLNGVKLRAPTRVTNMMFKSMGATPVGMPVPAVPEALSKGVIDATVIPWEVTGALKVPEMVTNHTEFGDATLYTTSFIFAMNKQRYDALPDDLKAVIDANSGMELSASMGRDMQSYDAPAREAAVEAGNTIITLTPGQVSAWKAASAVTVNDWLAKMEESGVDGAALRARAAELIEEYSAE